MKIETDLKVTFEGRREVGNLLLVLEYLASMDNPEIRTTTAYLLAQSMLNKLNEALIVLPLILLCACLLPAAPILSDGNETCAPAPCTVQVIAPHPSWLEAQWISHVDSGANSSMLTVPNGTVVSFFERFQIPTARKALEE